MPLSSYLGAVFRKSVIHSRGFLTLEAQLIPVPFSRTVTVVSFYLVDWNQWLELNEHKPSFPRFCAIGYLKR